MTPDDPKKKNKEKLREKKKTSSTEGRKPRIIYEREVALQLVNQLI